MIIKSWRVLFLCFHARFRLCAIKLKIGIASSVVLYYSEQCVVQSLIMTQLGWRLLSKIYVNIEGYQRAFKTQSDFPCKQLLFVYYF